MSSKRWCFTLNNYEESDLPSILKWPVKYLVVGSEVGTSGTPHLQGFVTFAKMYRLSAVKKLLYKAHWEPAKGTSVQAAEYCKKEGDFQEVGSLPSPGKRTDLENAIAILKDSGNLKSVADEFPSVYVKFSRGLRDFAFTQSDSYDHATVRGIWIYGPPGTGKSHAARHFDPDAYMKAQNKWWDGYWSQQTVILDDLDTDVLGHYLKIWADKWSCTGETKGGTVQLRHRLFVVTSNYHPSDLFGDDAVICEAICRRFKIIEKVEHSQMVDFLVLK